MDQIINHAVLSLDFWQDTVTYEGCTMPAGPIGCEVLNIPDSTIEKLDTPCNVLNQLLQGMNTGSVDMELLPQVQQAAGEIISFLQATPPFSRLNRSYFEQKLTAIFSEEYMEDAKAYLQLTQQEQLICALTGQHSKATMLVRIAQVLGHLSYSLGQYKEALTKFAERLNEPGHDRTSDGYAAMFGQFFKSEPTLSLDNPAWMTLTNASVQYVAATRPGKTEPQLDGYAAMFGQFFKSEPTLSLDNPAWMTLTNASVQYVAATRPGKTEPQLIKRMHYVSFVGMFRSDLLEGLCVGHAPKKCPICGRWFLTIDARHTKYCGGLAPGDQRGRTCRQIGNLRGREQRELADDHPIKAIYTRRMNTILQSTRRGKLDMSPLWGCSVPICLRGFVWAMHPRNAPSAADGFSPLMHGIPNTAVVWPPATNGDGRVGKSAI